MHRACCLLGSYKMPAWKGLGEELSRLKGEQAAQTDRITTALLSLTASVGAMQERVAALQERVDARPARPRKRPPRPAGTLGAEAAAAQVAEGRPEDRLQDGDVSASKQGPGRINSVRSLANNGGELHGANGANGGGGAGSRAALDA